MHAEDQRSVLDFLALPAPDFVNASYNALLGRLPDPLELRERSGVVRAGLGRIRFLADMTNSPEFRKRHEQAMFDGDDESFIEYNFLRYLNRRPDRDGLSHYAGLLADGRRRERIAKDISRSREARIKRTFWYELEHVLADERAERHWFKRWIGRAKRHKRQRNIMQEAALLHTVTLLPAANHALPPEPEMRTVVPSFGDPRNMGRDARKVLSRMRQSAGVL